jgi:hypothetical protein
MAVTLGTAMLGCSTTITSSGDGGSTASAGGSTSTADPTTTTSDNGTGGTGGTAMSTTASTGGIADTKCGKLMGHWNAYKKCCDSVNWDFAQGCEAWGPPMPPAMDWIAEEVA